MPGDAVDAAAFRPLYRHLEQTSEWGTSDRRGALNNLTPAHVLAAVGEVRSGRTVSLAAPMETVASPTIPNPPPRDDRRRGDRHGARPALRHGQVGDERARQRRQPHRRPVSRHLQRSVVQQGGPRDRHTHRRDRLSIDMARDGIVGRGVLLDIPRVRGVPWLEPGDHVTAADLEAAERAQHVRSHRRSALRARRTSPAPGELGAWDAAGARAGLHPTALPLLAERGIAALGSDGNNDTAPSTTAGIDFPIHVLAINAMGLHLLDYLQFEDLAGCARRTTAGRSCASSPPFGCRRRRVRLSTRSRSCSSYVSSRCPRATHGAPPTCVMRSHIRIRGSRGSPLRSDEPTPIDTLARWAPRWWRVVRGNSALALTSGDLVATSCPTSASRACRCNTRCRASRSPRWAGGVRRREPRSASRSSHRGPTGSRRGSIGPAA